jgi:hypothetical protein
MLQVLHAKYGFEPAEKGVTTLAEGKQQLRLFARVQRVANWLLFIDKLLGEELSHSWRLLLAQKYIKRVPRKDAQMVKGWLFILSAQDLEAACVEIAAIAKAAPTPRASVDEMPLPGGGLHRNLSSTRGKGARPTVSSGGQPSFEFFGRR